MSSLSGSRSSKWVGAMAVLVIILLAGLAQAATSKPVVIDTGEYVISYKASGTAVTLNPSGVISFRDIVFNPSTSATAITWTASPLTITINGKSADQLSIKKKKGVTTTTPVVSLESTGGFLKIYTDAPIGTLRAGGNIASLSSKAAVVSDAIASGFGSVKLAATTAAGDVTLDTWVTPNVVSLKPLAGKVSVTGIPVASAFLGNQNAGVGAAAKKTKTGMVPASVEAGAIITGQAVTVSVRGGDLLADTVQAKKGIKTLSSSKGADGVGGTVGVASTTETLGLYLDAASVAVVQHPGSLFASGLDGTSNAKQGIGTVSATTAINGVFVAGGTSADMFVTPNKSASVKTYKAPAASGDAFVLAPAQKQPAGIITH